MLNRLKKYLDGYKETHRYEPSTGAEGKAGSSFGYGMLEIILFHLLFLVLFLTASYVYGTTSPGNRHLVVLDTNVSRFTPVYMQRLRDIFNDSIQSQHRLLVTTRDRTILLDPVGDKQKAFTIVSMVLKEQAAWNLNKLHGEIRELAAFIDGVRHEAATRVHKGATYGNIKGMHPHYYMKFLKNAVERYHSTLIRIKENFLLPHVATLDRSLDNIRPITGTKQLITLYQIPDLPRFSSKNRQMIIDWVKELSIRGWLDELDYTRKLERLQGEIDDAFEVDSNTDDRWFDQLQQVIEREKFTFQSVLVPYEAVNMPRKIATLIEVKKAVEAGLQQQFNKIAANPGQRHSKAKPFTTGTLAVNAGEPSVAIQRMAIKKKNLSMVITGFKRESEKKKEEEGKLNVMVRVVDANDKVLFNKRKVMLARKEKVMLALNFKWLGQGDYWFITDAKDLLTGKAWAQVSRFHID